MAFNLVNKKNVLIYGAGEAGKQLANSLKKNPQFKVVGFLDDDKKKKNLFRNNFFYLFNLI